MLQSEAKFRHMNITRLLDKESEDDPLLVTLTKEVRREKDPAFMTQDEIEDSEKEESDSSPNNSMTGWKNTHKGNATFKLQLDGDTAAANRKSSNKSPTNPAAVAILKELSRIKQLSGRMSPIKDDSTMSMSGEKSPRRKTIATDRL